jgi:hypothetical protein
MKKIFLLGLCILISSSLFAQEKFVTVDYTSDVTYGIKAGITCPRISGINNGLQSLPNLSSTDDQALTSFYVGAVVNIPLNTATSGHVLLQSGLSFVGKGGQSVVTNSNASLGDVTIKRTISYIELPINLLVSLKAGTGRVLIGAGPYLGLAFSGQKQISSSGAVAQQLIAAGLPSNGTTSLQIGSGGDINTIDFGIGLSLGYQLHNGLSINIGSDIGLTNIDSKANSGIVTTNQLVSVGLGYSF